MTTAEGLPAVPEITPLELRQRLDNEQPLVLLDVREPFERDIADLPDVGQHQIPMGELGERMSELDPDQPTVVYCRSGRRSAFAVARLQSQGFTSIWNLVGGVLGWREDVDPSLSYY